MLCHKYNLPIVHYTNEIPAQVESERVCILWDTMVQTEAKLDHRRPDIVVYDHDRKRVTIIEFSVPMFQNMMRQRELKINRYTVNSKRQVDEMSLPYVPGPNLVEDLRKQTHYEIKFLTVIVGATGEYLKGAAEELMKGLEIPMEKAKELMHRMSRSAVEGSSRIIANHLA